VIGNLVWRIMCEGAILLFSLHELLVGIDTRTGLLVPGFSRLSIFPVDHRHQSGYAEPDKL
jgi:hypothetical protein